MLGMGPDGQESEIPKCTASLARLLVDVGEFGFPSLLGPIDFQEPSS